MTTDFSKGKRGPVVQPDPNKTRITIRLDTDILEHFKSLVNKAGGGNYQTLINNVLRDHIEATDETLEKKLRKIVREELKRAGWSWRLAVTEQSVEPVIWQKPRDAAALVGLCQMQVNAAVRPTWGRVCRIERVGLEFRSSTSLC